MFNATNYFNIDMAIGNDSRTHCTAEQSPRRPSAEHFGWELHLASWQQSNVTPFRSKTFGMETSSK